MPAKNKMNLPDEPQRDALPRPVVTPRSAAWFVREIGPFLSGSPELQKSLSDQQLALEADGIDRASATAEVVREVLRMSADNQPPLDGHSELARMVRICSQKILTDQWRTEPDPTDVQREQAANALMFHDDRLEEAHRHATTIDAPSTVRIRDTRGES